MGEVVPKGKFRRTTIELDENLYKRIKSLAVERDITMREMITEALEEKLAEEEKKSPKDSIFKSDSISSRIIERMEKYISRDAAIVLFIRKCEDFGYDPVYLMEEDLTDDFFSSICKAIMHISSAKEGECLENLKEFSGGH